MSNTYRYRNAMRKNLIAYKRLTGTQRNNILKMLGEPTRINIKYIFKKLGEVLTLHSKILLIEFVDDSTLKLSNIHE